MTLDTATPLSVLQPIEVLPANITASNVALETAWSAGTYALGDQVRHNDTLWEVSATTTTEEPSDTATGWFSLGPANRYRPFDLQVGLDKYRVIETVTTNADTIEYTLDGMAIITGFAMFGLAAKTVQIVATETTYGDLLNETYTVGDGTQYNGSFWRWFFLPIVPKQEVYDFGIVIPAGATVDIIIDNTGGTAEVGSICLGLVNRFGTLMSKPKRSKSSRSVFRTEGTLTSVIRRMPSSTVSFDLALTNPASFWQAMDALDGVAAVYLGREDMPELIIYGVHTNVDTTADTREITFANLRVQGL